MDKHIRSLLFFSSVLCVASLTSCGNSKPYLSKPQNVIYKDDVLYWNPVNNAEEYELKINDQEPIKLKNSEYRDFKTDKDFKIELKAIDNDGIFDDSEVLNMNFHILDTPKNFRQENGYLVWDKVANCESYEIFDRKNNIVYTVSDNKFLDYKQGYEHSFYLRAASDYKGNFNSKITEPLTFKSLAVPKKLAYDYTTNSIVFDDVNEASKFELKINDEIHEISKLERTYEFIPKDTKIYNVSVRSISDNNEFASSIFSQSITMQKLEPIVDEFRCFGDDQKFELNIKNKDSNVRGFEVVLNDKVHFQSDNGKFNITLPYGSNSIKIKKLASRDALTYFYLDSDYITIKVGAFKQIEKVKLSDDKKYLTWDPIEDAKSYVIEKEGEEKTKYVVNENKISIDKIDLFHGYFYIYAVGESEYNLSPVLKSFFVEKATQPKEFKIDNFRFIVHTKIDTFCDYDYLFEINGKEIVTHDNFINLAFYDADEMNIRVKIKSKTNKDNEIFLDSDFSDIFKLKRLNPVQNLRIEDNKVYFDGEFPSNCVFTFYSYGKDSSVAKVNRSGDFLSGYSMINGEEIGCSTTIEYNWYFTDSSKVYPFYSRITKLSDPVNVLDKCPGYKIKGRTISWNAVPGASKYYIEINGEVFVERNPSHVVDLSLLEQSNKVRIYSANDEHNNVRSYIDNFQFYSKPQTAITKFSAVYDKEDKLKLVFPKFNDGSTYGIFHDFKDYKEVGIEHYVPYEADHEYDYQVFEIHDTLDYYFDLSKSQSKFYAIKTPELNITHVDNYYTFSWDFAANAGGYEIFREIYSKETNELIDTVHHVFKRDRNLVTLELDTTKYYYKLKFKATCGNFSGISKNCWDGDFRYYTI